MLDILPIAILGRFTGGPRPHYLQELSFPFQLESVSVLLHPVLFVISVSPVLSSEDPQFLQELPLCMKNRKDYPLIQLLRSSLLHLLHLLLLPPPPPLPPHF